MTHHNYEWLYRSASYRLGALPARVFWWCDAGNVRATGTIARINPPSFPPKSSIILYFSRSTLDGLPSDQSKRPIRTAPFLRSKKTQKFAKNH
jgi:hypothetical protein